MESAPEIQFRPVHVLHHRFRMSANFITAARILMTDEGQTAPLQLMGSKRITLDKSEYYSGLLDEPLRVVASRFEKRTDPIYFSDEVNVKEINNGQSKIIVRPRAQQNFNELLATANTLPDINPQPSTINHHLFLVVKTSLLLPALEEGEELADFGKKLVDREDGRLHSAIPLELTGYDFKLPQAEPKIPHQSHEDLKSA